MVRFLCVHGLGTNGKIFESQTAGLRSQLPAHWEYEFYNAEIECGPAAGIDAVYPGPYLAHYNIPSLLEISDASEAIQDFIDQEGPFDGAMGFSAGGTLLLSMILQHQKDNPFAPHLFRYAIFFCTALPYSSMRTSGIDVTTLILDHENIPVHLPDLQRALTSATPWSEVHARDLDTIPAALRKNIFPHTMEGNGGDGIETSSSDPNKFTTHRWQPEVDSERAALATGFVLGREDKLFESGLKMVELVDAKFLCGVVEHPGGHELPRGKAEMGKVVDLIIRVVQRSEFI